MVRYASGPSQPNQNNISYSSSSSPFNMESRIDQLKSDVRNLYESNQSRADEIRGLLSRARADNDRIRELEDQLRTTGILKDTVEKQAYEQDRRIQFLKDENLALREAARSQDLYLASIGQDVRVRFVESCIRKIHKDSHQRNGSGSSGGSGDKDSPSAQRIRAGNDAVKKGQPVPDAVLCLANWINPDDYYDIYGVSAADMAPRDLDGGLRGRGWSEVPQMVEAVGYRGTLMAEGKPMTKFNDKFDLLLHEAKKSRDVKTLQDEMKGRTTIKGITDRVRERYDEAMEEGEAGRKRDSKDWKKRNSGGKDPKRNSGGKDPKRNSGTRDHQPPKMGW